MSNVNLVQKLKALNNIIIFLCILEKNTFFKEMATSEEDKEKFLDLCLDGDVDGVTQLLSQDPTLIKYKHGKTGGVKKK